MEFQLKDIKPNPFRHLERYPINRDKVAALKESMETTGFWDNLVARVIDGQPQIAYGHHRMVALKELYGPDHKIPLIVRDLDNETMLKIMARENMEEWGANVAIEHETIRAVVQAYADGLIKLNYKKRHGNTGTRYAPSFVLDLSSATAPDPEGRRTKPYDSNLVGEFVGWTEPSGRVSQKVVDALAALQLIEEGILSEEDFNGLTSKQAAAVVEEAHKTRRDIELPIRTTMRKRNQIASNMQRATSEETRVKNEIILKDMTDGDSKIIGEAKAAASKVGKAVATAIKEGRTGYKNADVVAFKARPKTDKPPIWIDDFAIRLGKDLHNTLDPKSVAATKVAAMIQFKEQLNPITKKNLLRELEALSSRALALASKFKEES